MRLIKAVVIAFILAVAAAPNAFGNDVMLDDFGGHPEKRWRFIADSVMGGVSTGEVVFNHDNSGSYARMTGRVSTANNGGFIQFRFQLRSPPPQGTRGIRLEVRGNDQRYFVHLRTSGTLLPWQYYQAGFDAAGDWQEVRLPLESFQRSGITLRKAIKSSSLKSIGIVAFGRDHDADIQVREVGFY